MVHIHHKKIKHLVIHTAITLLLAVFIAYITFFVPPVTIGALAAFFLIVPLFIFSVISLFFSHKTAVICAVAVLFVLAINFAVGTNILNTVLIISFFVGLRILVE